MILLKYNQKQQKKNTKKNKKMFNNINIQYKKFHCLRHTFATRCVRVGMDVKSLSEVLGHSNVSVTLGIYVHSSYEIKKKFIDKL